MTRAADLLPGAVTELLPANVANRRANWIEVARTDVADVRRSWVLWTLYGTFAVMVLLAGMSHVLLSPNPSRIPFNWGLGSITGLVIRWFVPLSALVVGAVAVVGEREARSL